MFGVWHLYEFQLNYKSLYNVILMFPIQTQAQLFRLMTNFGQLNLKIILCPDAMHSDHHCRKKCHLQTSQNWPCFYQNKHFSKWVLSKTFVNFWIKLVWRLPQILLVHIELSEKCIVWSFQFHRTLLLVHGTIVGFFRPGQNTKQN